jgi:hypothetical protein
MNPRFSLTLLACLATLLAAGRVQAHWITQSFDLKAGWNAVFLHVDASHATIAQHLAPDPNASIEEIWLWAPPASLAQFVQTPQEPVNDGTRWRVWRRADAANSLLQGLVPNAAYLVRVRSDIPTFTWNLKGKAVVPRYQWASSGLNFLGFPTVPASPPTFEDFLAQSPPEFQQTAEIFRYPGGDLGAGNPLQVLTLRATPVKRGEAYWVRAGEVFNRYYGPFEVVAAGAGTLAYGDTLRTLAIRLRNHSPSPLSVTLNLANSETPPAGQSNIVAVPPLLVRGAVNPTNLTYAFSNLSVGTPQTWNLAAAGTPGSDVEVVLGLDRSVLSGNVGDFFAGLLRFTDSLGQSQVDIGVSAKVGSAAGLWVGGVAITEVGHYLKTFQRNAAGGPVTTTNGNYVISGTNTSLGSVAAPYPLRLILHNPDTGSPRLFQRVFFGHNAATNPIVANREASLNRNLLADARRISAPHLPFTEDNEGWPFSGSLAQGGTLTVSVTNRFDNQVSNPFLHTYHPDHDNLNTTFRRELPQGSESYTLVRDITLNVTPPSNDFSGRVGAGQALTGVYSETIRLLGLARPGNTFDTRDFEVRGVFTLNRISDIPAVTVVP